MFFHKYDATSSWFGYEYQGVLAIYYAMKQINELVNQKCAIDGKNKITIEEARKEIKKYSVEIEWMEDFSILNDEKYKSFHQVKSGTSALKEEDVRDTFIKLLEFDYKNESDLVGYFHVISKDKLKVPKDKLRRNIKVYFKKLLEELNRLQFEVHINLNKEISKGEPKQILKSYMRENSINNNEINGDKRNEIIGKLIDDLKKINDKYFSEDECEYLLVMERLKEYPDIFNDIAGIEVEICNELYKFHDKIEDHEHKYNKEYIQKERCSLGCLLDKHVDERNKCEDENIDIKKRYIMFEEFLDVLIKDLNAYGISLDYYEFQYKKVLYDYYKEHKYEVNNNFEEKQICNGNNRCKKCSLENQINEIKKLSTDNFKQFLNNIAIKSRKDKFDFPNQDELGETIFEFMCDNHDIKKMSKQNIGIIKNSCEYWAITSLISNESKFLKQLFDPENDNVNILRDADIVITKHMQIDDVLNKSPNYMYISNEELKEIKGIDNEDEKYKSTDNYNKLGLISVEKWDNIKEDLK